MRKLLYLLPLLWCSFAGAVTCTSPCVQAVSGNGSSGTWAQAYGSNITINNLLVASVSVQHGFTITSVVGSRSGTWTAIPNHIDDGTYADLYIFYAIAPSTGADTVTVTDSNIGDAPWGTLAEISGVVTVSPLDQAPAGATYSFTNPTSGTTSTTTQATELLIGAFGYGGATAIAASGSWTFIDNFLFTSQGRGSALGIQTVTSTGTYTFTGTSTSVAGGGLIATFKQTGGASSGAGFGGGATLGGGSKVGF